MKDAIVFFAVVFSGLLLWFATRHKGRPRFREKAMLTGPDVEFFRLLRRALPDCIICPRVALSALIEPSGVGMLRQTAHADIVGKRVGYAVFDEDMILLAVIELDYRSRPGRKAVRQDACLASAGIRSLRFQAKRLPSEAKLCSMLFSRSAFPSTRRPHFESSDQPAQYIEFKLPKTPWRNTKNVHI